VPRLAKLQPPFRNEDQQRLYASITSGPRGGGQGPFALADETGALTGPFNAMLLHPGLGAALEALGSAVRFQGRLPGRARELAILVVAAHWASAFEQYAHEAVGRQAGLAEAELAAVRDGRDPGLADPAERAAVRAAGALVRTGDLDDGEYAAAVAQLGEAGVFELTTLVGYYATLALQLRVFRVPPPEGAPEVTARTGLFPPQPH
jgi:4-carboxymuconolactone decarboxylase